MSENTTKTNEMKRVEIVFILDKSGSMHSFVSDTIGGFNSTLKKQQADAMEGFVTTVLFDNNMSTLHDRLPLKDVPEITEKEYTTGGCTALLDALGNTIRHIEKVHRYIRPEDVPEKTMFVIITDGLENASHAFSADQVRGMIAEKQKEKDWEFVFLGANIDAIHTASRIGIDTDHASNFLQDEAGIDLAFSSVDLFLKSRASRQPMSKADTALWKSGVERDYNERNKNR